ncbi:MAG: cytochrome c [Bdellovibrionota bacterium]
MKDKGYQMSMLRAAYKLLFSLSLLAVGCDGDPNATKLQYMPDMADAPTVKAQKDYIDPPDSSVAMNAIIYPKTPEDSEKQLQNPFANVSEKERTDYISKGDELYHTFCVTCHGPQAKGNGTITDKFPRAPDLTAELYAKRGDGFFFHRISFGSAIMPSYGHAISPHERWYIILYLRTLQKVEK